MIQLIMFKLIAVVAILTIFLPASAQETAGLEAGQRVIVTSERLTVYARADRSSPVVAELGRGRASRIMTIYTDETTGAEWAYLENNAYGWAEISADSDPPLIPYSNAALEGMIELASGRIDLEPGNIEGYLQRGTALVSLMRIEEAIQDYGAALALDPESGLAYELRGIAYSLMRDWHNAALDLFRAIQRQRALPNTYSWYASAHYYSNRPQAALDDYAFAISLEPEYGLLYANWAGALRTLQDFEAAITKYTQAIEVDPYLVRAYYSRATAYAELGHIDLALQDYERAMTIDPQCAACYVERGAFFARYLRDEAGALSDFNRATELDPFHSRAYANRANTYAILGNWDQVIADMKQAALLDPYDDYVHYTLAGIYSALDRYEEAEQSYSAAIRLRGSFSYAALLYRAQIYIALGGYASALSDITVYIDDIEPKNLDEVYFLTTALLVRGRLHLESLNYEAAAQDYQAALTADRDFAQNYAVWGAAYRVSPDRTSEITELYRQLTQDDPNVNIRLRLATLLMEVGRWSEALTQYEAYVELLDSVPPDLTDFLLVLRGLAT